MTEPPPKHRLTIRLDIETLPGDIPTDEYADQLTGELCERLDGAGRVVHHAEA